MTRSVALLATCLAAASAAAQVDPRIDPDTGRQLAHWPPARHFDHLHMRLAMDIPTMGEPSAHVVETLRVAPIGRDRDRLELDADNGRIVVRSISSGGVPLAFEHASDRLAITLEPAAALGRPFEVVIEYDLNYRAGNGAGLTWSPGDPDGDSATVQAPQIHSQGQPASNSRWICCHDWPNERLTTELVVTVDDGLQVCSNGRMLDKRRAEPGPLGNQRSTWHWLQDKDHPYYLVLLVVGKFDVVDVGGPASARPGLSIPVYTAVGTADAAEETFAETPGMIAFFEEWFDEPYPWDKYAQLMVRNFAAGGMENTSATTLFPMAVLMGPEGARTLIAHELAHQWTGDLITCKSWEHTWLNEGWASYAEALWAERLGGQGEYLRHVRGFLGGERGNRTAAPENPPLVSNRWGADFEPFARPNNPYSKGAMVLHMLRMRLGDETFQRAVRAYIDRHKFTCVETDDFRKVLEDVSGQDLERFFRQWCYRPGTPRLSVSYDWNEDSKRLGITAEQTQRIDGDNPAFALSIPIYAKFDDDASRYLYIDTDRKVVEASFDLPSRPVDLDVDPHAVNLCSVKVEKELAMWIEQLERGATILSRLGALDHLTGIDDPAALAAIHRVAEADADPAVREAARGVSESGPHRLAGAPLPNR